MTKTQTTKSDPTRRPTRAQRDYLLIRIDGQAMRGSLLDRFRTRSALSRVRSACTAAGWLTDVFHGTQVTPAGYAAVGREHLQHAEALDENDMRSLPERITITVNADKLADAMKRLEARRALAAEQPRRDVVTATVDSKPRAAKPVEQTKAGNYLLRSKDSDKLVQVAQLVADGMIAISPIGSIKPVLGFVVAPYVRRLFRAGLIADPVSSESYQTLRLSDAGRRALEGAKIARAADRKRHRIGTGDTTIGAHRS
jgi:hypothetical protein